MRQEQPRPQGRRGVPGAGFSAPSEHTLCAEHTFWDASFSLEWHRYVIPPVTRDPLEVQCDVVTQRGREEADICRNGDGHSSPGLGGHAGSRRRSEALAAVRPASAPGWALTCWGRRSASLGSRGSRVRGGGGVLRPSKRERGGIRRPQGLVRASQTDLCLHGHAVSA